MLDVVANHVGPVGYDYSSIIPFNQQSYYHNCNPCPSNSIFLFFDKLYFKVVVAFKIFSNQPQVEWCRLANLVCLDFSSYLLLA